MSVLIGIFVIYISYYFFIKKDYNLISITTTILLFITILVKLYLKILIYINNELKKAFPNRKGFLLLNDMLFFLSIKNDYCNSLC